MAKKSKLLTALDRHQGRDYELEKQQRLLKQAKKRKFRTTENMQEIDSVNKNPVVTMNGNDNKIVDDDGLTPRDVENVTDDGAAIGEETKADALGETDGQEEEEEGEDQETDDSLDIALSDIDSLASSERGDLIPHQRLTINNTTALLAAHKAIALSSQLPFSAHQVLSTGSPVDIADVHDDLSRELAFYKQCLSGAENGRKLLRQEGVPFSRPNDYFAEMVKNDEHMGKIKRKMVEDAGAKKASQEAKRQRELKKFGKQVQVAKEQERAKAKKATLEKIDLLKRKRKSGDVGGPNEEDQFDIALEDAAKEHSNRSNRKSKDTLRPNKRHKKDEKFGFGGKKRFGKSGDAVSSGDVSGYSAKRMKGGWQKQKRPGKNRRANQS